MASTSRSDRRTGLARQRRSERLRKVAQPAKTGKSTRRRVYHNASPTAPPVMVRNTAPAGSWRENRRPRKTRRRFDVALGVPGAEMRLPSLPQVGVGWRLVSFALSLLLGLVLFYMWNSPAYRVDAAVVSGLQRITTRDVNAVLGVSGKSILTLDPANLQRALETAFPEFAQVSVSVGLPATVEVSVVERKPVLTWRQNGRTELVDTDGMAFPVRDETQPPVGPLVEASSTPPGLEATIDAAEPFDPAAAKPADAASAPRPEARITHRLLKTEMVAAILAMAVQAPQNTPLVYDAQHGLGWQDGRGWKVYFGDTQDIEMKLQVYKALVKKLRAEDVQPVLISVEYVHAPYYRLEQ